LYTTSKRKWGFKRKFFSLEGIPAKTIPPRDSCLRGGMIFMGAPVTQRQSMMDIWLVYLPFLGIL
jgi:hypothetical protein